MNTDVLLEKLTALDFMAVDLGLYLDTHPNDKEAICVYNEIISEADKTRVMYEKVRGPLCSFRSRSKEDCWTWDDDPWPWSENFNCKPMLAGEEK